MLSDSVSAAEGPLNPPSQDNTAVVSDASTIPQMMNDMGRSMYFVATAISTLMSLPYEGVTKFTEP